MISVGLFLQKKDQLSLNEGLELHVKKGQHLL